MNTTTSRPMAVTTKATSVNGALQQQAAQVFNAATGTKELIFTIANSGTAGNAAHDTNDLAIFPGGWKDIAALDARTTFICDGFASIAEMIRYFSGISCNISGVRMETTNTDNFDSTIIQVEKDPTGEEKKVRLPLSPLKVPLGGGGYNNILNLASEKFSPVLWNGLDITFSKIKAASQITFYLSIVGWDKMRTLTPLAQNFL
jgi:hypothetical protein